MSNESLPPSVEPRYRPTGEFNRPPGVYFDSIADAWTLLQREMPTYLAIALISMILIAIVGIPLVVASAYYQYGAFSYAAIGHPPPFMKQVIGGMIQQGTCLVSFPLTTGIAWVGLKQIRGEEISIATLFEFTRALPRLLTAAFVYGLIIGIGTVLFIVPALYAAAAFSFAGLLILDQEMPAAEALVLSAKTLGVRVWNMTLLQIVLTLFIVGGFCLFFVGALFAIPIYYLVIALHYNYYFPSDMANQGYTLPEYH